MSLFIDLYELTMAQVYWRNKMFAPATFSLFIRDYPAHRGYLVSAGAEDVITYLEDFRFEREEIDYLAGTGRFDPDFLDYLKRLRFNGDLFAICEGRIFFRDEPILEVQAPIIEAQLVESALINTVNFQVMAATKVARCVFAAEGRRIVDFGMRRSQGRDASLQLARAGYIAGLAATSNVLAGRRYGIPVAGTMAHSFVTSFDREIDAFRAFAETFGDRTVLLIDTYDTLAGAEKAITVAGEMAARGDRLRGVRLDSGDMTDLSIMVRRMLDQAGLTDVEIFASGGLDEYKVYEMLEDGAQIDAFGLGTKMVVSADDPYTDMAYKLVQYDGQPVLKLSTGKKTLVAPKQIYRYFQADRMLGDTICLRAETRDGEPLMRQMMHNGRRRQPLEALDQARKRFTHDFERLPEAVKAVQNPVMYPVNISEALDNLQKKVTREIQRNELGTHG